MKAPGGRTNNRMLKVSGSRVTPKIEPEPRSSRQIPRRVSPRVNPRPIPIPSNREATGEFLAAKASARPRIIQLTTISGINNPSDASISGRYALITICRIVTKAAITTMNTGMRTLSGVTDLRQLITKFVQISTAIVASPIDIPFMAEVVVASVGHIPSIRTNVGFSLIMPFLIICIAFISLLLYLFCGSSLSISWCSLVSVISIVYSQEESTTGNGRSCDSINLSAVL